MLIFDTDQPITSVIPTLLKNQDSDPIVVIRYIAPGNANAWKCITPTEALAIQATGGKILLGLVYETNGRPSGAAVGASDGAYARQMIDLYGVPQGGFLAYTSGEDTPSDLDDVGAAFTAFYGQMTAPGGGFLVRRVAYAAGATCDYLKAHGEIDVR
jgi:hypothetical protein